MSSIANIVVFRGFAKLFNVKLNKFFVFTMVAERISTSDILNIGAGGKLEVILPNYKAVESAKVLVARCKLRYPRDDGLTWRTEFCREKNMLTIYLDKKKELTEI